MAVRMTGATERLGWSGVVVRTRLVKFREPTQRIEIRCRFFFGLAMAEEESC